MSTENPVPDFDRQIAGTPFRGLILRGFTGYCAYIGVPQEHWLANMEDLHFKCHRGITFRGYGDGVFRPQGWYWYGWDYQRLGDKLSFPAEVLEFMPQDLLGRLAGGKEWTVAEIEEDLMDAAMSLREALQSASGITLAAIEAARSGSGV